MAQYVAIAATLLLTSAGILGGANIARTVAGSRAVTPTAGFESPLGRLVAVRSGGETGRIVDVLIDSDGKLGAAVMEFGGFLGVGTRKIAVDWRAFHMQNGSLVVDIAPEMLRLAKDYRPGQPADVVRSLSGA